MGSAYIITVNWVGLIVSVASCVLSYWAGYYAGKKKVK
jgi:membrane protein DedA with SNARE-associated domain